MFPQPNSAATVEDILIDRLAEFSTRPLDFVLWAFPWGEPGSELANRTGPVGWQYRVLADIQAEYAKGEANGADALCALLSALRIAIKSGHDVGKTALLCWIIWWAIATKVNTRGRCTANTEKQLRTILWAELAKWHRMFIAKDLFRVTATRVCSADPAYADTWRVDAVPWSEDNPDAFSGLHNYGGRIILVFDEASGIADPIWERTDGVTREADTEILWVATSNPTKNFGRFFECFNKFTASWMQYTVDSREVPFTNKADIETAITQWGEDSDYVRVRFRGLFPNTSMLQLIPIESIRYAQARAVEVQHWEPLVLGVDIARFGNNESVAVFRRGKDSRTVPALRWRGATIPESGSKIASLIHEHTPDAVFIDEGGVGGGVVDFVRHLGHTCVGVNFGVPAPERPGGTLVGNLRAMMYVKIRDWLREGGCIEAHDDIADQLTSIEYHFDKKQQIMLMSKEDMRLLSRPSPDWADALAMTFAYPVSSRRWRGRGQITVDYDPLANSALPPLGGDLTEYGSMH